MPEWDSSLHQVRRLKMVKEQLVARGIRDERVLSVMGQVPRHLFVEEALRDRAYDDHPLPIGARQTISQPYIVALMTEALALVGTEKVLEVGSGCGYQSAVLAGLAARVCSIERIPTLFNGAWRTLSALRYRNVVIRQGDGSYGMRDEAPFDAIIVTACAPEIPPLLLEQLKVGGRLVLPVGNQEGQSLKKVVKNKEGTTLTPLSPCLFVPLIGAGGFAESA